MRHENRKTFIHPIRLCVADAVLHDSSSRAKRDAVKHKMLVTLPRSDQRPSDRNSDVRFAGHIAEDRILGVAAGSWLEAESRDNRAVLQTQVCAGHHSKSKRSFTCGLSCMISCRKGEAPKFLKATSPTKSEANALWGLEWREISGAPHRVKAGQQLPGSTPRFREICCQRHGHL